MSKLVSFGAVLGMTILMAGNVMAGEYFVSVETGKGKKGTKEEPAKEIGGLLEKLQPGDVINVAGGVYLGKGGAGRDEILMPVKIIGGWNTSFSKRDPWGATKTILSGDNKYANFVGLARLEINLQKFKETNGEVVIDGLLVDNSARNRYSGGGAKILRKMDPKTGENATPESAGILVRGSKGIRITIKNCIVTNAGPTTGALMTYGGQDSKVVISNNLLINNTGAGIEANSSWHPKDGKGVPVYTIENNTVLFTWKHDPFATYGGYGLAMDADTLISVSNNVFAFSDITGVYNAKKSKNLTLKDNLFQANLQADYIEFNTKISVDALEDDASLLSDNSGGNVAKEISLKMNEEWSKLYMTRQVIDRNAAEADVKVLNTRMNAWRGILGLPLQGTSIKADSDVWLNRLSLEDAFRAGVKKLNGKYGCEAPRSS